MVEEKRNSTPPCPRLMLAYINSEVRTACGLTDFERTQVRMRPDRVGCTNEESCWTIPTLTHRELLVIGVRYRCINTQAVRSLLAAEFLGTANSNALQPEDAQARRQGRCTFIREERSDCWELKAESWCSLFLEQTSSRSPPLLSTIIELRGVPWLWDFKRSPRYCV